MSRLGSKRLFPLALFRGGFPPLLMGYAKEKKSRLSLCFLAGRWMIRGVHSRKDWLCQGRMAKQGREAGLPSLRLRQGKPAFAKASENPSTQGVQGKKKGPAKGRVFGSSCLRYCYGKASRPSLRLRQAGLRAKKNKTRSTQSDVRDECSCLSQSYRTRCPDSIGISESGPSLDACTQPNIQKDNELGSQSYCTRRSFSEGGPSLDAGLLPTRPTKYMLKAHKPLVVRVSCA